MKIFIFVVNLIDGLGNTRLNEKKRTGRISSGDLPDVTGKFYGLPGISRE